MAGVKLSIPLRKQCAQSKIRHYSRAVAEEHARSLRLSDKVNRPTAGPVITYRCEACEAWHVGHAAGVSAS